MNPEMIRLLSVKLLEMNIYNPLEFEDDLLQSHAYDLQYTADFDLELNNAMVFYDVQVSTLSEEPQEEEATAGFTFTLLFSVDELAQHTEADSDGEVSAGPELDRLLGELSQSTVRGLMINYLQGTALRQFILPVASPARLLEQE